MISLLISPFFLYILTYLFPSSVKATWDEDHGIVGYSLADTMHIVQFTFGLSKDAIASVAFLTFVCYTGLIVADVELARRSRNNRRNEKKNDNLKHKPSRYDVWSQIDTNNQCYEEMFSEPIRLGRLLRSPGNALSNAVYFFGALLILLSASRSLQLLPERFCLPCNHSDRYSGSTFLIFDVLFGLDLLILSIASTLWHGSNSTLSHYIDLWSMDCCIISVPIRNITYAALVISIKVMRWDPAHAKFIMRWLSALSYLVVILLYGRFYYKLWKKKWLHGPCPLSTRARLSGTSDIFGMGHKDVFVSEVCIFAALAVILVVMGPIIEASLVGDVGSLVTSTIGYWFGDGVTGCLKDGP